MCCSDWFFCVGIISNSENEIDINTKKRSGFIFRKIVVRFLRGSSSRNFLQELLFIYFPPLGFPFGFPLGFPPPLPAIGNHLFFKKKIKKLFFCLNYAPILSVQIPKGLTRLVAYLDRTVNVGV